MFRKPMTQEDLQELNLTPFLDVMITLIPFLMLSVSFTAVVVVKAALPTPISNVTDAVVPPPFDLVAQASPDSVKLFLNHRMPGDAPVFAMATPGPDGYSDAQLSAYHSALASVKKDHPTETRIAIDAHPSLSMERLAQLMDQSRQFNLGEATPGTSGQDLFPQVALKGVYVP